ncbi:phospholipase D family protein [Photobacterium ganghwense]|uniref:phospholipase D family protein n=1 Tax=Photobacterium ganghwense TaxID=320778 RepID=UPI004056E840
MFGCSHAPSNDKHPSQAMSADTNSRLAKVAQPYVDSHPELTGFYPLADGQEAFLARLALIHSADNSIDLQYYIYRDDATSSLLTYALYKAAERGVRVRVLLDDMQSRDDAVMASLSSHPNIEVRLFNPFRQRVSRALGFIGDFDRLNRRMHNKALIVDGTFGIAGGRNIGDEYFSANGEVDFGDFDLLMLGNIIPQLSLEFDTYWNSKPASPIEDLVDNYAPVSQAQQDKWEAMLQEAIETQSPYVAQLSELPLAKKIQDKSLSFYWGEAELHYDPPEKIYQSANSDLLLHELDAILSQTQSELFLVSPYFVPTRKGTNALTRAANKGITLTIITNSLASNDVFAVHGWYAKYRKSLLEANIRLYEVKADRLHKRERSWLGSSRNSLHAKTFIIDKQDVFVGSFNFDPRSAYLNTEMGVLVQSPAFADDVYQGIEQHMPQFTYRLELNESGDIVWFDDATGKQYSTEPDASMWLRIAAWFSGILPIENLL